MNIIESHQNEMMNDALKEQEAPKPKKGFFERHFSRCLKCFTPKPEIYINDSYIDRYIDQYFIMNCPETHSISEINQSVYHLIHQLFI